MKKSFLFMLMAVLMSISGWSQEEFVVGDENATGTTTYAPTNAYYNYSISQSLYTESDLSGVPTGTITAISYKTSTSSYTATRSWKIYLAEVETSSISSSNVVSNTEFTEVFSGTVSIAVGDWTTIELDEPFVYTGSGNLVIMVSDFTGSYISNRPTYVAESITNTCIYYASDSPNSPTPLTAVAFGSSAYTSSRPVVKLTVSSDGDFCPGVRDLTISNLTAHSTTVSWAEGEGYTSFAYEYKKQSEDWEDAETGTTSSNSIDLSNLDASTYYDFRVMASCSNGLDASFRTISFATSCDGIAELPITWDFETVESDNGLPICWTKNVTGATTGVYASTSYPHNGTHSMYVGSNYYAVLPAVEWDNYNINDLELRFYMRRMGYSTSTVEVGVMTNPNDISTFETVASFSLTQDPNNTTFEEKIAMFSDYTGEGTYIAIRTVNNSTAYLDDMTLEEIPACPPVQNITVTALSDESATLTWTGINDDYLVRYRTESETEWNTDNVETNGASATISNLSGQTTYTIQIAPDCEDTDDNSYRGTSITTPCSPSTNPYTIDFETASDTLCWTVAQRGFYEEYDDYDYYEYYYPEYGSYASYSHSSSHYWTMGGDNSHPTLLVAPKVDVDIDNTRLQFWVRKMYSYSYYNYGPLQIGVMTNPNDANTFVALRTIAATDITATYSLQTIDFNAFEDYSGSDYYIAFRYQGTYSYDCGEYVLDDITITNIPACVEPSNLVASAPTENSITLSWSSNASDFKVYYRPASSSDDYMSVDATLDEEGFVLADLNPSTTYTYYVASVCGDGSEANSQPSTFATSCGAIEEIPFTENFEAYNNGTLPQCWDVLNPSTNTYSNTSYPSVQSSTYRGHASAKGVEFHVTNTVTPAYLIMPAFQEDLSNLSLVFWTRPESDNTSSGKLEIGYMTDATQESTFVLLDSVSTADLNGDTAYHKYRVNFNDITLEDATSVRIAFRHVSNASNYYWYLDDISVEELPDCTEPSQLSSSNITSESAELTWNVLGSPDITLYYKTNDETEYTAVENPDVDENNVYLLEELSPNTTYQWYVSATCDGTELSSEIKTFTTLCVPVASLPYEMDFEGYPTSGYPTPDCWKAIMRYNNQYPYVYQYASDAHGGSAYYRFYPYSSATNIVSLPSFEESIENLRITFWLRPGSNTTIYGRMEIGVMTDLSDTSSFQLVETITASELTNYNYTKYDIDFNSIEPQDNTTYYITFRCFVDNGYAWYLDDVKVDIIPACAAPSSLVSDNVTSSSVNLSWAAPEDATTFIVYYKKSTENEYTAVEETISENSYILTGLESSATYQWKVAYICSENSLEVTSDSKTFTTACEAITELPVTWDFETGNVGGTTSYPLPACWNRTSSNYYPYAYNSNAHSGSYSLYFYNYYTNTYATLPYIDTEALPIEDIQLSFYAKKSSNDYNPTLEVGVMTDPSNLSTFTLVQSFDLTISYPEEAYTVTFAGQTAPYIAFRNRINGSYDYSYIYVDDITIDEIPACLPITNLSVSSIGETSATVSWTGLSEEGFIVTYSAEGSEEETFTVNETNIELTDLVSSTHYTVTVVPVCTEGSVPERSITFLTACTIVDYFPYLETFSDSDFGCWTLQDRYCSSTSVSSTWTLVMNNEYNNITPVDGTQFAYFSPAPQYGSSSEYLVSPIFDITSLENPAISFDYKVLSWNTYLDSLALYYRSSVSDEWTLLFEEQGQSTENAPQWNAQTISLPNPSSTYQVAFKGMSHWGYGAAIDNVTVFNNNGEEPEQPIEPTVVTNAATNIAQTTATLNGEITELGNQTITARGFEWKTTVGGTYATVSATGTTMTASLTGLTANTSYTYRAFATTTNGTQYGEEETFTTLEAGEEPCTPATATLNETVCYGETFTFNGNTYTTTGTYTTTVAGVNGECDTNYTINLTVNAQNTATETITVCYGETAEFNGQALTEGENTVTVAGQGNDCDTLYTVTLVVRPENNNTVNVTINPDELPYQFGTQVLETEGTYTEVFTDINGCDSTVVLTLTVNSSINDVENGINVMLYPNPTTEDAMLRVEGINSDATIYVTDVQGRTIKETKLAQGESTIKIETSTLASGVYYIRIVTDTINRTEKLIKK